MSYPQPADNYKIIMDITIKLTDEELHDLANQVQVTLWKTEMNGDRPSIVATVAKRVIEAANQPRRVTSEAEQSAFEYVGKYFAMKARAEHLDVQNAILMKAVEQMAQRGSVMQSALIEAGLAKLVPPPARLLNVQPIIADPA